jgi:hypothetical protein
MFDSSSQSRGNRGNEGMEHKLRKSLEREMKNLVRKAGDNSGELGYI